ncbi:ABC transporter substrate-binding protein [Neptuniibacter sp. 1_MG-2023]|uniref:substrate-binding periplasmic protein n=1 Tax=Neptuniibacter sp. 1_MG-2023 TaxID=3062662 RepID=UPI0026E24333|nr:transporter substrate-binding domain-containing protein [Neptuniibacter sp. 1_MG-2023]MDO6594310.1 transporter substrate-binding domain-containing protein [Neptuniibacter sp. 1_MG-2023]
MAKLVLGYICLLLAFPAQSHTAPLEFKTTHLPPFMFTRDGNVEGPGKEIIAAACKAEQLACHFEMLPWRRAHQAVKRGTADGLFLVGKNSDRAKWLYFSPPILETGYGFFSHSSLDVNYTRLESLAGLCVAVNSPSNMLNRLKGIREEMVSSNIEPIKIITTTNFPTAIKMVNGARCDLVFGNVDVVKTVIKELQLASIRPAGFYKHVFYYVGLSKSRFSKDLVDRFNQQLMQLYQQGKIQTILRRYDLTPADLTDTDWDY